MKQSWAKQILPNDRKNIIMLKDLTHKLSSLDSITEKQRNYTMLKTPKGTGLMWGVLKEDKIAVSYTFMSKGTIFPEHQHDVKEWFIVCDGGFILNINNENIELNKGDSYYIEPNVNHSIVDTLKDTWFLSVTVPADRSFPDVE